MYRFDKITTFYIRNKKNNVLVYKLARILTSLKKLASLCLAIAAAREKWVAKKLHTYFDHENS